MAATLTNKRNTTILKSTSSPRLVTVEVAFDANGDSDTITAAALGLKKIYGFAAGAWSNTADYAGAVASPTDFTTGGVTTMTLQAYETDKTTTAAINDIIPVLFWGE